jgi:hypothetical protein
MEDGQQLIAWACGDGSQEVPIEGADDGAVWFNPMTAWFTTSVDGVVAVLGVTASAEGLRVGSASFLPPLDVDAVAGTAAPAAPAEGNDDAGPVSRAAVEFDHVGALAELAGECVITRDPYSTLGRIPAAVRVGNRPLITTTTLQRIAGSTASPLADRERWQQVDALIEEFDRTPGRKGLAPAVADRLGVSIRTAHRYIGTVRAQRAETIEVRFFSNANLEVK